MTAAIRHSSFSCGAPLVKQSELSPKKLQKIEKIIRAFHWQDKLLAEHLLMVPGYQKFLKFLYDSRLVFSIHGYETSLQETASEMREGIKMIRGEPHILRENVWTKWDEILKEFEANRFEGIVDSEHHRWNYLYPNGLTQKDRCNLVEPVHHLSPEQLERLYGMGQKFFAKEPEKCPEKDNCSFIQVFTTGDSFSDRVFGHVGIRLIDREGHLYSFGFERPREEAVKSSLFKALSTYNVGINSLDFKEFAKFKSRRVTTIPVNSETFAKVFQKIQGYAANPLRFNFMHQNCVTFAADTLREAGVSIDTKANAGRAYLYGMCPRFLRKTVKAVDQFFNKCPNWIKIPIKVITFIPSTLFTVIQNLFNLIFGAGRAATPMQKGAENELDNSNRLTSFDHLYTRWTDIFKVHKGDVPYAIADWQRDQPSTETFTYHGPRFYI